MPGSGAARTPAVSARTDALLSAEFDRYLFVVIIRI